jgi:hypothetical protein
MTEVCDAAINGLCGCFDEDRDMDDNPSGCDEEGCCLDEYDNGCDQFEENLEVCDECGGPLGFCAPDCSEKD